MCHVSCVMCHVSHVTCHVSRVTCHALGAGRRQPVRGRVPRGGQAQGGAPRHLQAAQVWRGGAVFRTPAISNTQLSEQSVEFWDAGVADSDHQGESRQTHFHKRHYLVQCILREHWSVTHQVLAAHSGAGQARQAGPGQLQQPGPELPAAVPR